MRLHQFSWDVLWLTPLIVLLCACSAGPSPTGATSAAVTAGNPERGKSLFQSKACGSCHTLAAAGAIGILGPKLDGIGTTAASRVPNESAESYLRESITNPNAFVVPGYQNPSPMPPRAAQGQDLEDMVTFLLSQR
jgi:cytochrome c551/c552